MSAVARRFAIIAVAACAVAAPAMDTDPSLSLEAYMEAAAKDLPQVARDTLARIVSREHRLLALRAYFRAGADLDARWSWSAAEIERYRKSEEYRAALAEIDKISARFAADNPGYTLYVNTQVRSLDLQLERWRTNASVGTVAAEAEHAALRELRKREYRLPPDADSLRQWRNFLRQWFPSRPANLAAPGLSPHGRARAFDFQIRQNGKTVAGTDTATIAKVWDGAGWARKLETAVRASDRFVGPLLAPREPWHYEYRP